MKLRIAIDPDRCHGHGRCYVLSPDVFDADDEGFGVVADVEVSEGTELEESALRAAAGCPESAISIEP